MSFECGADFSMGGKPIIEANKIVDSLEDGIDVLGLNCGTTAKDALRLAKNVFLGAKLPLWLKPNAGVPSIKMGRPVYPEVPSDFGDFAREAIAIEHVSVIGGCCGTTAAHISDMRAVLASANSGGA